MDFDRPTGVLVLICLLVVLGLLVAVDGLLLLSLGSAMGLAVLFGDAVLVGIAILALWTAPRGSVRFLRVFFTLSAVVGLLAADPSDPVGFVFHGYTLLVGVAGHVYVVRNREYFRTPSSGQPPPRTATTGE